jgi:hypothetical protein
LGHSELPWTACSSRRFFREGSNPFPERRLSLRGTRLSLWSSNVKRFVEIDASVELDLSNTVQSRGILSIFARWREIFALIVTHDRISTDSPKHSVASNNAFVRTAGGEGEA